jgi:hypothetical protein
MDDTSRRDEGRQDGGRIELSTTEARQGTRENVVRYVLIISMAVVIIGFAVIYYVTAA